MEAGFYSIYTATTKHIAHGWRQVFASPRGKKAVAVIDCASGDSETVAMDLWRVWRPVLRRPPQQKFIKTMLRKRGLRTRRTKLEREVIGACRRSSEVWQRAQDLPSMASML